MVELPPLQPQQLPPEGQRPGRHAQPAPQEYPYPPPPQYSYPPPQYPYPPPQQPPPPPPPPRRQWPLIAGVSVLFVIFIAALANQGNGSAPVTTGNIPQTTTDDSAAPSTEAPLPVTTEAPPPAPPVTTVVEAPSDNGWADVTVTGCSTHTDFGNTFAEANVRITNHTRRPESYVVTVGLNNAHGDRIGEALATSNDLPSGRTVTVTGGGTANTSGAAGMRCELSDVLRMP